MKILPQQSIKHWYFYRRRQQQISVCCHNTHRKQTVRNFCRRILRAEVRHCSWKDRFLTKLTSVKLKTWPNPCPQTFKAPTANQTGREVKLKLPELETSPSHHSPYTPHWEHGLWAHDCPTRDWKDRKTLQCSSQCDKEQWDMYLASQGTAKPQ